MLKVVNPPISHNCNPPDKDERLQYGVGSIWECDICGRQARPESNYRDGIIWVWLRRDDYMPKPGTTCVD